MSQTKADAHLPPNYDPAEPMASNDEHFCRMIASGVSLAKAVEHAYGHVKKYKNDETRRQRGFKLVRMPVYSARIHHLRTLEALPEFLPTAPAQIAPKMDLSRSGLIAMMAEITEALSQSVRALDAVGAEPRETGRLRADLLLHVKRLDRLQPTTAEVVVAPTVCIKRFVESAKAIKWCQCVAKSHTEAGQ